jgi:hypothetical protein
MWSAFRVAQARASDQHDLVGQIALLRVALGLGFAKRTRYPFENMEVNWLRSAEKLKTITI